MYNHTIPDPAELPSSRKLLRSTLIAIVVAGALLVTVVLPAEYAIDPTGIGRALGLTQMGEIKTQLAREAAADVPPAVSNQIGGTAAAAAQPLTASIPDGATASAQPTQQEAAPAAQTWKDQMQVVLQRGEGAEIKLVMKAGAKAEFSWTVQGGTVNFDTHGDGGGQSISYEKVRNVPADEGVLVAAFDGNHGWFWRNRGDAPVTVVVRVRGEYQDIKRLI